MKEKLPQKPEEKKNKGWEGRNQDRAVSGEDIVPAGGRELWALKHFTDSVSPLGKGLVYKLQPFFQEMRALQSLGLSLSLGSGMEA